MWVPPTSRKRSDQNYGNKCNEEPQQKGRKRQPSQLAKTNAINHREASEYPANRLEADIGTLTNPGCMKSTGFVTILQS